MSYSNKMMRRGHRRRPGMGAFDPFASISNLLTPKPTIDMPEEFVGNQNALPICPVTDGSGWCRRYVGGPPVKSAINPAKPASSAASASSTVQNVISSIFGALVSPVKTPTVTPVTAQPGMSTGTKLALAGGAVALVVLVASRR
jgi:hypothetical protein